MTGKSMSEIEPIVMGWYEKYPEMFDQDDNKELFRFFITSFLGLKLHSVAEMRLEKYSWSTIERTIRLLVSKGQIKLSSESKEARHIEEEKTKKAIKSKKEPINYADMYDFVGGKAVPKK